MFIMASTLKAAINQCKHITAADIIKDSFIVAEKQSISANQGTKKTEKTEGNEK